MTDQPKRRQFLGAAAVLAALLVGACSSSDPDPVNQTDETVTVGSAGFTESEIIAELYAIALEDAGFNVERRMQIGAREAYYRALEDSSIDLIPEYTGNLLQFLEPASDATTPDEILTSLKEALPEDMRVLEPASAEDKDSWVVDSTWSERFGITSLDQLATTIDTELTVAGNPELQERPYGPRGLSQYYDFPPDDIVFIPIDDGGGPATVTALLSGEIDMANIYTTSPMIEEYGLVVLDDPKNMIISQNVIPLLSDRVPASAEEVLNAVSENLTTEDLIAMNAENQGDDKTAPAQIARQWLQDKGLLSS